VDEHVTRETAKKSIAERGRRGGQRVMAIADEMESPSSEVKPRKSQVRSATGDRRRRQKTERKNIAKGKGRPCETHRGGDYSSQALQET